jgi:hypothetical protein
MSVRPRQAVLNAVNASQGFSTLPALASAGLNGILGGQQGLDSIDLSNNGSGTSATFGSSSASLLSGFGRPSDDEDEEMDEAEKEGSLRLMIALSTADTGESENVGVSRISAHLRPLDRHLLSACSQAVTVAILASLLSA